MVRFQNNFTKVFLWWPSTKIAKIIPLRWQKWPPKLKIENLLTTSSKPMAWFQNNFTEMFLGWPSTKIIKMVPLHWTKWPPKLKMVKSKKKKKKKKKQPKNKKQKKQNKLLTSPPRPMAWFQNNFTEMFLGWPSTKITKMVPVCCTKWPPELILAQVSDPGGPSWPSCFMICNFFIFWQTYQLRIITEKYNDLS